jgi:hypothetical protein
VRKYVREWAKGQGQLLVTVYSKLTTECTWRASHRNHPCTCKTPSCPSTLHQEGPLGGVVCCAHKVCDRVSLWKQAAVTIPVLGSNQTAKHTINQEAPHAFRVQGPNTPHTLPYYMCLHKVCSRPWPCTPAPVPPPPPPPTCT